MERTPAVAGVVHCGIKVEAGTAVPVPHVVVNRGGIVEGADGDYGRAEADRC